MFADRTVKHLFTLWYSCCLVMYIIWSMRWLRLFSRLCMLSLVLSGVGSIECSPIWTSKCSFCTAQSRKIGVIFPKIYSLSACNLQTWLSVMCCYIFPSFLNTFCVCVRRSHHPLSSKDRKPCGVGLEAEVVLTRGVSCEGEFTKFTIAFGHLNLESRKDTVRPTFPHLWVNKIETWFLLLGSFFVGQVQRGKKWCVSIWEG